MMIKLKDILKESAPGFENRQFGDPLPTLRDIAKKHQEKNGIKEESVNEAIISADKIDITKKYQEKNGEIKEELIAEKKELGGAMINTIDRLTDSNNHNEARLQLAKSFLGKNSPLVKGYESLISLHNLLGDMNTLMKAREKLDKILFAGAKRMYSDYDAIQGVF